MSQSHVYEHPSVNIEDQFKHNTSMEKLEHEDADGGTQSTLPSGPSSEHPFLAYKLLKQTLLICAYIVQGFGQIIGPSIPDLSASLGYTYEEISGGLSISNIGAFLGSIIGGILNDSFPRRTEIIMAIFMVASSLAGLFLPMAYPFYVLAISMFIMGISCSIQNTGAMPLTLEMWGDKGSSPTHALHFGFGVGAIIAPFIVRPFLSRTDPSTDASFHNQTTVTAGIITTPCPSIFNSSTGPSQLMYPFGIVYGTTILIAVLLALIGIFPTPKGFPVPARRATLRKLLTPSSCYPGSPVYSTVILILLFLYFFHAVAAEFTYGTFVFTFVIESGPFFDKPKAAMLTSVYWGSFVFGRFSGIFLSHELQPQYIITGCLTSSLAIYISVILLSTSSSYAMWILTILAGYSTSLPYASGILWGKEYIAMNSMAIMVCVSGASLGLASYFYMTGYLFDSVGVKSFGYILTFHAVCYIIIFAVMQAYVYKYGRPAPAKMGNRDRRYNPVADKRDEDPSGEESDE